MQLSKGKRGSVVSGVVERECIEYMKKRPKTMKHNYVNIGTILVLTFSVEFFKYIFYVEQFLVNYRQRSRIQRTNK